jgi:osmotically-inducible protein OsmY
MQQPVRLRVKQHHDATPTGAFAMNFSHALSNRLAKTFLFCSLTVGAVSQLSACFPLVAAGALGGTLAATDRRTLGTQLEDRQIQLKAESSIARELKGTNVNVTAYNRKLLLTGEVPDEQAKKRAEAIAGSVENVAAVVNELQVGFTSSLTSRAADATTTTKVKAMFVDDTQLLANAFKVTTERGVVYLMGRVTEAEGERAAQTASRVGGVTRVIKVLDPITEQELARMRNQPAPTNTSAAAPAETVSPVKPQ